MPGWLTRVWNRFQHGGVGYLLSAFNSYCPNWLLSYHHTLLFTRTIGSLGLEEAERRVTLFDESDRETLKTLLGLPTARLQTRFDGDELCFGIAEGGQILSSKRTRYPPTILHEEKMYSPLDLGENGFYLHSGCTLPEARRQGSSILCPRKLSSYFIAHGRTRMYTAVEYCNRELIQIQRRLGVTMVGEVFIICLLGLCSVCRRRWLGEVRRLKRVEMGKEYQPQGQKSRSASC